MKRLLLLFYVLSITIKADIKEPLIKYVANGIKQHCVSSLDWEIRYRAILPLLKAIPYVGPVFDILIFPKPKKDFKSYADQDEKKPFGMLQFFEQHAKSVLFSPISLYVNGSMQIPLLCLYCLTDYTGARIQKEYVIRSKNWLDDHSAIEKIRHIILFGGFQIREEIIEQEKAQLALLKIEHNIGMILHKGLLFLIAHYYLLPLLKKIKPFYYVDNVLKRYFQNPIQNIIQTFFVEPIQKRYQRIQRKL